jgi:hypothetical protein
VLGSGTLFGKFEFGFVPLFNRACAVSYISVLRGAQRGW